MPIFIVFAFALPFLLWPLEMMIQSLGIGYIFLIEELAKAILLFYAFKNIKKGFITYAIILGSAFFLTETIFYFFNIFGSGSTNALIMRVMYTLPIHILTSLFIAVGIMRGSKAGITIGLFLATITHLLFNLLIKRLGL